VVKTDYLALGKGVLVTADLDEAVADARAKLEQGAIVVEECMVGPEFSLFAVCDGTRAVALPPAQDHKRVGDGDTGPNTGGMGAYSPVPFVTDEVVERTMRECVLPTLAALQARGIDYRGVLYAGLMLTPDGPRLLEYNVRFGDPEAQVVLPRLTSDLAELLAAAAAGDLRRAPGPAFADDACVTVVLASAGYPGEPRRGDVIEGLDAATARGATVFAAGVGSDGDGRLVTAGGRVLAVTGTGATVAAARRHAYAAVGCVSWPGMHYRRDIARTASEEASIA
jgi:phosphoribosylamine--glycine ligase